MKRRLKQLVVMVLAGWILICPSFATTFPDVDEYSEYAGAVEYISGLGLMIGDDRGNFNPNITVSRAEMATILLRLLGETENLSTDGTIFSDVPASHWSNKYVVKAAELGIISGYGNGYFGPSDNVTYEQSVTMIIRAIGGGEVATLRGGYPDGFLAVAEENLLLEGIMAEKGEALSRSDIALILYNYYMLRTNG